MYLPLQVSSLLTFSSSFQKEAVARTEAVGDIFYMHGSRSTKNQSQPG